MGGSSEQSAGRDNIGVECEGQHTCFGSMETRFDSSVPDQSKEIILRLIPSLFALLLFGLVGFGMVLRESHVDAQTPCFPVAQFSTVCAPVERVVTICPDQLAPFYNSALAPGYSYGMPVAFYGATYFWNPIYPVSYYYGTPFLLELSVTDGVITKVRQLTDRPCGLAAVTPTPVSTPAPTIVYVPLPAPALPSTFEQVKAGIAAIRPPSTGSAGLLTSEE